MFISEDSILGRVAMITTMCDHSYVPETVQWLVLSPISSWSLVIMFATVFVHLITAKCRSKKVKTTMYYRDSTLSKHIKNNVSAYTSSYETPAWAISPFLNTILSSWLLRLSKGHYKRDYLQLTDKGVIAMDWFCPHYETKSSLKSINIGDYKITRSATIRKNRYILIVVPDVNCDSFSVSHVGYAASKKYFSVVVFNRRGESNSILSTPKLLSYGDPSDLRQLVKYIKGRYPRQEIVGIGFGAGADLLIAYLGEYGSSSYFRATVAISPLYDPQTTLYQKYRFLSKPLHFFKLLKEKLQLLKHYSSLQTTVDIYETLRSPSYKQFYKHLYYKLSDCVNDDQFWDKNSPLRDVDDISSPLLCISSLDDPFCHPELIPYDLFSIYPNMCLLTAESGGHCGFIESKSSSSKWSSWAVSIALEYIQSVVSFSSE